jgi:phage terminase small subunit
LKSYIDERMADKEKELIADQDEVLKYLTSVLRGETQAEVVVVEGTGMGESSARKVQKAPDEKERLKAAELLGKRYGIFKDKVQAEVVLPVFEGEERLED